MHQVLQVFLRHPGHLSLLKVLVVQIQEVLEDPCHREYHGHPAHQAVLVHLLLAEIPVVRIFLEMDHELRE